MMKQLELIVQLIQCTRLGGVYSAIPRRVLSESQDSDQALLRIAQLLRGDGLEPLQTKDLESIKDAVADWSLSGVETISFYDKSYPSLLREIADPPPILFFKGSKDFPDELPPMISIVGSRKAGAEGSEFARYLAFELAKKGVIVVSGLALGIDGCAHRGALQASAEFPTIAVLGNGLDTVYPTTHFNLAAQIVSSGGFLLSQFEPGQRPYPSNFLNRNRLIAGLSLGTIVVQAAKRSGSLATARCAIEAGREVFAVPGLPTHKMYQGTNNLLKLGARVLTDISDIYDEFPELNSEVDTKLSLTESEISLVRVIHQAGELSSDDLLDAAEGRGELSMLILSLEEKGLLVRLPGNRFSVSPLACGI